MFRFIAFAWDSADVTQADCAGRLSRRIVGLYGSSGGVFRCPGLVVHWTGLHAKSIQPYLLSANSGVILGTLFRRSSSGLTSRADALLDATATANVVCSGGRDLIRAYWGRYVAFLCDTVSERVSVVRDPTGGLPCFLTSMDGVSVFFSRIDDCVRVGGRYTVNWGHVLALLATTANERLNGTGLHEVEELHGGECAQRHAGELVRQFYWNPFEIACSNVIDDPIEAATQLGQTVQGCVHAWASCYDGIIHRLSGGLDSSIVAMSLSDAPTRPRVTCFNHFSAGAQSDERAYARLVVQRAGYRLLERERDPCTRLDQIQQLSLHPYPLYARYSIDYGRYEATLAQAENASAIFCGEWGDALFHSAPSDALSAIDCARQCGIGRALFLAALDSARLEGTLVWQVLWHAVKVGARRTAPPDPRRLLALRYRSLLSSAAAEAANEAHQFDHPWLKIDADIPPGKRWHIYESTLIDFLPFYDPLRQEGDPDQLAPLNSQPIVELCLRIPMFVLVSGGWDRAMARRAFLDRLPFEVATRRSKGGVEAYQKATFMHNIAFARESLLDGALVAQGLIDRAATEEVLSGKPTRLSAHVGILYWLLCTEAWIARWRSAAR